LAISVSTSNFLFCATYTPKVPKTDGTTVVGFSLPPKPKIDGYFGFSSLFPKARGTLMSKTGFGSY
jgi:hypothetical protein